MISKFSRKFSIFFGLQAILFGVIFFTYIRNYDVIAGQHFYAATIDKHELLKSQTGPRLIFVGGSNVAFGIDSKKIAQEIGYQPVNMGLHGGLGLEYYLREIQAQLRDGDVIIISPEYEHFVSLRPDLPERLLSVMESRPKNIQFVPLYYIPSLTDKFFIQLGSILRSTHDSLNGSLELDKVYQRNSFNEFGDVVVHYDLENREISRTTVDIQVNKQSIQQTIKVLNEFNQLARNKNVLVFFSYPPLLKEIYEYNLENIHLIEAEMNEKAEFIILDTPKNHAFTNEYFFDTEYHLNRKGVQRRAENLANKLLKHMPKVASQAEKKTQK